MALCIEVPELDEGRRIACLRGLSKQSLGLREITAYFFSLCVEHAESRPGFRVATPGRAAQPQYARLWIPGHSVPGEIEMPETQLGNGLTLLCRQPIPARP